MFWGVAVIGATGLMLWFPTFFTRVMPGWVINVATTIHSDEALLAVGFIFTVHFFNTHFRPEKFPMDTVIFTGGVPLEEFKRDRPREYQEMVESGQLEQLLMPAPLPLASRKWRRFGFTALGIGLFLIVPDALRDAVRVPVIMEQASTSNENESGEREDQKLELEQ